MCNLHLAKELEGLFCRCEQILCRKRTSGRNGAPIFCCIPGVWTTGKVGTPLAVRQVVASAWTFLAATCFLRLKTGRSAPGLSQLQVRARFRMLAAGSLG